jgi:hypothetical protein
MVARGQFPVQLVALRTWPVQGGGCGQLVNLERASHGITGRLAPSRAVGGFGGPVGELGCR